MTSTRAAQFAGSLLGAAAVVLGAFGTHALRGRLDEHALAIWHTATEYQFWHALALLAVGLIGRERPSAALGWSTLALAIGTIVFCASLYALALGAPHWIGAITPVGGLALIAGWSALAVHVWRDDR